MKGKEIFCDCCAIIANKLIVFACIRTQIYFAIIATKLIKAFSVNVK